MLHVVGDDVFAGLGQGAVAAGFGGHVDDDGAVFHAADHVGGDDDRRFLAGNGGGGDDHIGHGRRPWPVSRPVRFLFGGQFAGIAADTVGGDAGVDELGAERFDLLAGGGAHVIGFDHGAQALAGGDRLQAGDAGADDQHAAGRMVPAAVVSIGKNLVQRAAAIRPHW
jgi:hypothetical protein